MFLLCTRQGRAAQNSRTTETSSENPVEAHLLGQALQRMSAAVLKAQAGAGDEIAHGAGNNGLARCRLSQGSTLLDIKTSLFLCADA
jgi:hypothetical protein